MKILVVSAHPVESSFVAALKAASIETLAASGHVIDDCDLYAEGFDPVLSRDDRIRYHDTAVNRHRVLSYVERLKAAEGLVFVHPVWNFGYPAILKGFLDRVFLPGVSFDIDQTGRLTLTLQHIRRFGIVCTYGADRWRAMLAGDPPRKIAKRMLQAHMARGTRCDYLACYDMNHPKPERRRRFLDAVQQRLNRW